MRFIRSKKYYHAHFLEVLNMLDCFGVQWWLMQGTLLAAVRDGKFIPGSGDYDIAVAFEDVAKVKNFGNGIVSKLGGIPVLWNYGEEPVVNVQAFIKIGDKRYFITDDGLIQQELPGKAPYIFPKEHEQLLAEWYGEWEVPTPGVHAETKFYHITVKPV